MSKLDQIEGLDSAEIAFPIDLDGDLVAQEDDVLDHIQGIFIGLRRLNEEQREKMKEILLSGKKPSRLFLRVAMTSSYIPRKKLNLGRRAKEARNSMQEIERSSSLHSLTPGEVDILRLLAAYTDREFSDEDIAQRTSLKIDRIIDYAQNIRRCLRNSPTHFLRIRKEIGEESDSPSHNYRLFKTADLISLDQAGESWYRLLLRKMPYMQHQNESIDFANLRCLIRNRRRKSDLTIEDIQQSSFGELQVKPSITEGSMDRVKQALANVPWCTVQTKEGNVKTYKLIRTGAVPKE
jgi:hypothetical protein